MLALVSLSAEGVSQQGVELEPCLSVVVGVAVVEAATVESAATSPAE